MNTYQRITTGLFKDYSNAITSFPDLPIIENETVKSKCREALQKIRFIIDDDNIDNCVMKIEEILRALEDIYAESESGV